MSLEGQTALVTGAALRIGQAIVLALAEQRANVVIHYRHSATPAEELRRKLVAQGRRAGPRSDAAAPDKTDQSVSRPDFSFFCAGNL